MATFKQLHLKCGDKKEEDHAGNALSDKSFRKLDEVCKVLDDKSVLGKKYDEYAAQMGFQSAEPQPAAI